MALHYTSNSKIYLYFFKKVICNGNRISILLGHTSAWFKFLLIYIPPWRTSYGVSFARLLQKIDHIIMALHYTSNSKIYLYFFKKVICNGNRISILLGHTSAWFKFLLIYIPPWRTSYGVSFARLLQKIDHIIMALHYTSNSKIYLYFFKKVICNGNRISILLGHTSAWFKFLLIYIPPWRTSYGVSFARLLQKIDHIIMALHYTSNSKIYLYFFKKVICNGNRISILLGHTSA